MAASGGKMDKKIAAEISSLMLDFSGKLDESIYLVMNNCPDNEFRQYRDAASQLMTIMLLDILNPIYQVHPDLKPSNLE